MLLQTDGGFYNLLGTVCLTKTEEERSYLTEESPVYILAPEQVKQVE